MIDVVLEDRGVFAKGKQKKRKRRKERKKEAKLLSVERTKEKRNLL